VDAYWRHLEAANLNERIYAQLEGLDVENTRALQQAGQKVRQWVRDAPLPDDVAAELATAYSEMSRSYEEEATDVAVRSSATAEDLPTASFAGQQDTYLNVRGLNDLERAVRNCMASLFTDRAIAYRREHGFKDRDVALSVGVQKMVRSDVGSAGVLFTLHPDSGFREMVVINGAWGLGETVVQGRVDPDEFWVFKPTLRDGKKPVVHRELGAKRLMLRYAQGSTRALKEVDVPREQRDRFVLTNEEALTLARWSMAIEEHYGAHHGKKTPMDIEWAKDGITGELFIVQARPETVHAQISSLKIELFRRRGTAPILVTGKAVGNRIGTGPVRVIRSTKELDTFQAGEVLVATMTDPDWEPVLKKAVAVVTDHGGRTCHAAIVARELGIPCVVGAGHATTALEAGKVVTVSCADGDEGRVYEGEVAFDRIEIDPGELPEPPVPLMVNLADPDQALDVSRLPTAGVGLLRVEFIVSNWVGIHPMALAHPERITDPQVEAEVRHRTRAWSSPADFFVDRLATGVGQIAAAFYPRPVIVRFSDFKTDEYARLFGGADFELPESNPMIGFRGASRYYDERYRDGFALECAAIRRVRDTMGLTNVLVMIPFCRTVAEGKRVLEVMADNGLSRGENGLKVYVMCEIPNNVILADRFAEIFDGFSIGSNDLTQLTLGIDRNSELLMPLFDERDEGVKRMISSVIKVAHEHGRPVGICGQAPSDHPDFAEFLIEQGIDTISLTPDAVVTVARRLGGVK
jgi:pyruvate,water dikinase